MYMENETRHILINYTILYLADDHAAIANLIWNSF